MSSKKYKEVNKSKTKKKFACKSYDLQARKGEFYV